jgi:hypothetical protein
MYMHLYKHWVALSNIYLLQCSDGPSNKVVFLFNTVIYVFLLLGLCILIVQLP